MIKIDNCSRLNKVSEVCRIYTDAIGFIKLSDITTDDTFVAYLESDAIPGLRYCFGVHDDDVDSLFVESDDLNGIYTVKCVSSIQLKPIKQYYCSVFLSNEDIQPLQFTFHETSLEEAEKEIHMQIKKRYTEEALENVTYLFKEI
ncbi:hypothetical protein CN918_29320 [Priestia megaterium]|nr:hypothetical protein CN918_29320 [Priestia megaterium]